MKRLLVAAACAAFIITAASARAQTAPGAAARPGATSAAKPAASPSSAAEAAYDEMIKAWHEAKSLYYESDYQVAGTAAKGQCSYKIWLKKPNYVRLEAYQEGQLKGLLVGDGDTFYAWWPGKLPRGFAFDVAEGVDRSKLTPYMKHPAPAGQHSIARDASMFGIDLAIISDPSMFSGAPDPTQASIDSGRLSGSEMVGSEKCDVLHLAMFKGKAETTLWLSQKDHLPRKERRTLFDKGQTTITESWKDIALDGDVADDEFAWKPDDSWRAMRKATIRDGILPPGTVAPEFTLMGSTGERISLSDFKGKVVWLHIWTAG
jgi:outer membrane lipoprotein-sorting protein